MKKTLIAMAVAGVVSAPVHAGVSGSMAYGYWDKGDTIELDPTDPLFGTVIAVGDSMMGGILVLSASGESTTNGGSTVYGNFSLSASGQELGNWDGSYGSTGVVVGIKGDFGNISLGDGGSGAHLGQLAGDRMDVTRGDNYRHAIGYTNSFEGITIRATSDPSETGENTFGLQGVFGGVTVGFGKEADDTVIGAAMSFGDIGLAIHSTDWDAINESSLAIKVSYSAGDLSASYQTEDLDGYVKSQLDVSYSLGGGAAVSLRNRADDSDSGEYTRILLSTSF